MCHHNSFIVYNSLKNASKERWRIVSHGSVGISVVLSMILSIVVYLSFRDSTESDCLENFAFDNIPISVSRVFLALTMVFTYPLEQFVSRHCVMEILEAVFHQFDQKDVEKRSKIYLFYLYGTTLILWSSSLAIGASTDNLGFVLALNGSFCASALGYVIPALCIIKTHDLWVHMEHVWNTKRFFIAMFMFLFGFVALIAGTVTSILHVLN